MIGYLPPPTGGVRVLFRQLTDELRRENEVEIKVVSLTGKRRGLIWKTVSLCNGLARALYHCFKVDVVSLQPTNQALVAVGPLLHIVCRLLGRPLIIRKFGGSFHETFSNYPVPVRILLNATVFKADLWLLETHFLVSFFKDKCRRVAYYPNSRPPQPAPAPRSPRASRFVFLSHISRGKGVEDLFNVSDRLPPECRIDLYGPLGFDISESRIEQLNRNHPAVYKGMIPSELVQEVLAEYDAMILPTRLRTEGYPGVILEAYTCGLPVVASDCGAIGEIVDRQSGLLVEPGNLHQLERAILEIHTNTSLFKQLQEGALDKAKQFDSRLWTAEFLRFCRELHETTIIQ
jgi:glycosyltransferase involved in cell wall biosynthesis